MKQFKHREHAQLNRTLTGLLEILNATRVASELAPYIDGTPAVEIQPDHVLQAQRLDKAQALPGAREFTAAGVDLTLTIPACPVSAPQLNAIAETALTYAPHHMSSASGLVCYSQKAGKWVINPAGAVALESTIVKLAGNDEKTYDMYGELFTHVAQHSPDLLPELFPSGKQGPRGDDLNEEWLVQKIKVYRNK